MRLLLLSLLAFAVPPALAQDTATSGDLDACGYLCTDGSPLSTSGETPPATDLVKKIFLGTFSEYCSWAIGSGPSGYEPEIYDLSFKPSWDEPTDPERALKLYRFPCNAGAYNEQHVYFTWTADDGVNVVSFAEPTYAIDYLPGDAGTMDGKFNSISLTGMTARLALVNSSFDAATETISEWSCWRGVCDASSRGVWAFDQGHFRLVTYDIDPTYDGEVNQFRLADFTNPTVIDTSTPLPVPEWPAIDEEEEPQG